jgi:hypothetical protein
MDEGVGFLFYYYIDGWEEVVVDLFFAEVHSTRWVEAAECGEAEMGVGDVDELHFLDCLWDVMGCEGFCSVEILMPREKRVRLDQKI